MENALLRLERFVNESLGGLIEPRICGTISEVAPAYARVAGLSRFVKLGDCVTFSAEGQPQIAEVVQIDELGATIKSFSSSVLACLGERAYRSHRLRIRPHRCWKGRVINALANPIDGAGAIEQGARIMEIDSVPPPALHRARVQQPIRTGVRVIDLFTPLCAGQRIGIFAGPGVGKSTLLSMLAGSRDFDSVVIALVGERGREVREFLDDALAPNRSTAVAVVATGDESPVIRRLAPRTAMAVAEYFRDLGESVLLVLDSITRFAHAVREVALAAGEPAVARGYTPSVFGDIPKLLERAGPGEEGKGSITGVFSVLVDGDDHNDPVADAIRSTLDGHIVLDREIAEQGRFPAVNVLRSISRLAHLAWTTEQRAAIVRLRKLIASYEDTRDLRLMGGYREGSDPELDHAAAIVPRIYEWIMQFPQSPPSENAFRELTGFLQST